ncbi:hypothetical protein F7230_04580 [Corynebacterium sp. 320]|uniref:hypothetical protein n=1 Tax=Corynebacterium TaxID=1716 RepID=UPI00125CB2EE|nr:MULTISPECIES: hypothetical protein [Corynebacterium]KAB1504358.1 hypothetical protein F7230_04580 [Corynebacterium sp. 320]KAB1552543.1 hypothetical protein F7233_02015 [Corynebacterium sp. 321]KAB1554239.1 hypothetical protein F7232_04565 [Corynebacterium sp. 319]KAB3528494.1 hypothetical protein F8354_04580 [Corynebacterium sp. 250]KAB3540017.1 hypothetical protein F8390_01765 [Corynebacterium sp. 366]
MSDDVGAQQVAEALDMAARHTPLKRDVLMWRGVRNWQAVFGETDLSGLPGLEIDQRRFTAVSTDRSVAEEEFTTFGKAGALLKMTVRKGTPGVWMPANGSQELAYQQEFLVPPGAIMKVIKVEKGELPTIHVELSNE